MGPGAVARPRNGPLVAVWALGRWPGRVTVLREAAWALGRWRGRRRPRGPVAATYIITKPPSTARTWPVM